MKLESQLKLMGCDEVRRHLDDLLRERLSPALAGRLRAHFLFCEECAWAWGECIDAAIERGEISAPEPSEIPPVPSMENVKKNFLRHGRKVAAQIYPLPEALPLQQFYQSVMNQLELRAAAAPEFQSTAFVINQGNSIPVTFVRKPLLNRDGEVIFNIRVHPPELMEGKEVSLNVTYLPTGESLGPFKTKLGRDVTIKVALKRDSGLENTLADLEKQSREFLPLPSDAFSFRLWWEEDNPSL